MPDGSAILNALADLALVVDGSGRIMFANAALARLLGAAPSALIGGSLFDCVTTERERVAALLHRSSRSRQPLPGALTLRTPLGPFDCRVDGCNLSSAGAAELLLLCRPKREAISNFTKLNAQIGTLSKEVAARRLAEAQLHQLNATLEQRIAEEVAQRQKAEQALHHAQKLEAVGQLTGGVAHDFNNLLTVVIGALELTHSLTTDPRIKRHVDAGRRAAARGARLTEQLLAFSRKQVLRPELTDVNALILSMGELLPSSLGPNIELVTNLAPNAGSTFVGPAQLQTVILNLTMNARDAMPSGGRLTIETAGVVLDGQRARDLTPGEYVLIAVSDTGVGIPPAILDKVFEPFFTTKEVGKGSGLGLPQVYGFARQSGGEVRIYSEVGHGTTVRLYLAKAAQDRPSEARPESLDSAQDRKATILVVDDEPDVRAFAVEVLESLGHRVFAAEDGKSALDILRRESDIDLLFTDVIMPGENGIEVVRQARMSRPDLRVLYTSGYTAGGMPVQLTFGGHLLSKPYTPDELVREIRIALAGRGDNVAPRAGS